MAKRKTIPDVFDGDVIGQKFARRRLSLYYRDYKTTGVFSNCLFVAQKGQGKTHLCRATGKKLGRRFLEVPSGQIRNEKQLYEQILIPFTQEPCTFFFDELHGLQRGVANVLLSVLSPNKDYKNRLNYQGQTIVFDFKLHTLFAATTEPQQIFLALKDRFKNISLGEYSIEELLQMVAFYAEGIKIHCWDTIAKYLRTNARSAFDMADEIKRYCRIEKKQDFNEDDAERLFIHFLDLFEYGLSRMEIQMLKHLQDKPKSSLTELAAKSGMTPQAQRGLEREWLARRLIEIDTKRSLTQQGREYLARNNR